MSRRSLAGSTSVHAREIVETRERRSCLVLIDDLLVFGARDRRSAFDNREPRNRHDGISPPECTDGF
jgi:hypothetical protein